MSTPEVRGAHLSVRDQLLSPPPRAAGAVGAVVEPPRHGIAAGAPARPGRDRAARALAGARVPLVAYGLSRVLYLAVALGTLLINHSQLGKELRNWDGKWYTLLAAHGYPEHLTLHTYSTLGFLPLFSILMWPVEQVVHSYTVSGVLLSLLFGALATVLVHRVAREWWGEAAARRAIVFFCFFPGTIVFSMVYTEGLLLVLVVGSLLALERRRWLLAGVLAGLATAVAATGFAIIPVTILAAAREIRARGWRDREARRSLLAPLLSPVGAVALGVYLWARVGSPFATFTAQRDAWHSHSNLLALVYTVRNLVRQVEHATLRHPGINLNYILGLLGAVFLAGGLVLLWRDRRRLPATATAWTLLVAFLTVTTEGAPPNPRLLLCAFPVVLVYGVRLTGRAYRWLLVSSTFALVGLSILTFLNGSSLRP